MSNYPFAQDDDVSIPRADANITELSPQIINAIRSAIFAIEQTLGVVPNGAAASVAARLNTSLDQYGNINPSVIIAALNTLQITDAQVSPTAAIQETKINLAHSTTSLFNSIVIINNSIDIINGFISTTGVKVEPHIAGTAYNHFLSAIDIDSLSATEYTNRFSTTRNNSNANALLLDINTDFTDHQRADGTSPSPPYPISSFNTISGQSTPSNFAHSALGIYINPSSFSTIPQSNSNLQAFAEYVDSSSLLLLGGRVQNLYSNGISRASRSTILTSDGYAEPIVPPTSVTTYLLGVPPGPAASAPVDNTNDGDDVVLFNPSVQNVTSGIFAAQFAQIRPGDILTVNYGVVLTQDGYSSVTAQFAIDSIKSLNNGAGAFAVRIIGKNLYSSTQAMARIDRSLFHTDQYGVLAVSRAPALNNSGQNAINGYESLIVSNPKGAVALGVGFNSSQFDSTHYNLYLALYPTGNPLAQIVNMPAIDITGNKGQTPGLYTLDSIVNATNLAFRAAGYNYRFVAFEYQGNFGISLADPYNNASFSIISGVVDGYGNYTSVSNASFANNVIDIFGSSDAIGFGIDAANVASPPFAASYVSEVAAATNPTIILFPLKKTFYYVNGAERDTLKSDPIVLDQITDSFGDGYWPASISSVVVGATTVSTSYSINLNLSQSGLAVGKTVVIQPAFPITDPRYSFVNYGRFIIKNIAFSNVCGIGTPNTTITVYDSVHATSFSPYVTSHAGTPVNVYFSDDSVEFDAENVFDDTISGPFKRFFEIYVDANGHTFTHERARFATSNSNSLSNINFYSVSPKLRGYPASNGKFINFNLINYSSSTGVFDGYLSNGIANLGNINSGGTGEVVRFYDETNIDYIEFIFSLNTGLSSFSNASILLQLFPSLQLTQDFYLLATCQVDDNTRLVSYLEDRRQFGNVSEQQFSDSAIDFINAGSKYTEQNGIVRGFDYEGISSNVLTYKGGVALVNGKFANINNFSVKIPLAQDNNGGSPTIGVLWAICANSIGEIQLIPLTDYNPSVNAINNPGRALQLFNVVSSNTYYVDSSTFTNIVDSRKDLAMIALVNSQVSNSSSFTFTQTDARKFVTDTNGNDELVYTSQNSQGNFKSISAMMTWGYYNSSMQTLGLIRGNSTFATDPGFISGLSLQGDGNPTLTFSSSVTINGVSFTGIHFIFTVGAILTNTVFVNCTFTALSTLTINSGCQFINCTFTANNVSQVPTVLSLSSSAQNIIIDGCTINYVPSTSSGYTAGNLINSGSAFIYCSVTAIQNITIKNCSFTTSSSSRFSFISFEYNSTSAIAQTIHIENNKFFNTSSSDDVRAVIAIVSNITASQPIEGMKLIDCLIQDNLCDKNQMIAITVTAPGGGVTAAIATVAVRLTRNTCGTISVIGANDSERNYETYTNTYAYDKHNGVVISNNTFRFLGFLDNTGTYFLGMNTIAINTTMMSISNNTLSYCAIQSGAIGTSPAPSFTQNGTLFILNNSFRAYNPAFLANYGISTAGYPAISIATPSTSHQGQAIVTGNTVCDGYYLTSSNTGITYSYSNSVSIIMNTIISNNVFNNVQANNDMITVFDDYELNVNISNNQFYRGSTTLNSYINVGSNGTFIITGNFFDSTTVDGSSNALIAGTLTDVVISNNVNYTVPYTIVQPLILNSITGFSPTLDGGAASTASSLCFCIIPLPNLMNNFKLHQVKMLVSFTGTYVGGSIDSVTLYESAFPSPIVLGTTNFPGSSPGSPFVLTITPSPANHVVTTTTNYYWLLIDIGGSETATITFYAPEVIFV